jgi:hypothetical protein
LLAGTWRGYEAGPEGLEILVVGAPNLGEDPREDVDGQRDWWLTSGVVRTFDRLGRSASRRLISKPRRRLL